MTYSKEVPFTFDDAKELIGKPLKSKSGILVTTILSFTGEIINLAGSTNMLITYKTLLESYTFLDGSPCGKLETK